MEESARISFFSKKSTKCPACGAEFNKEELLTGRGRLIAGNLTDELRRIYEPSPKFGDVYPLIYPVTVCPQCLYSAFMMDFPEPPKGVTEAVQDHRDERVQALESIFPVLDFRDTRGLEQGIASYALAISCYDFFPDESTPVIRQGISALRAAWLCGDLHRKYPGENYDYLSELFYRKARFFYNLAVRYDQDGTQNLSLAGNLGPDLDKNYGYDGLLYLSALLEFRYGTGDQGEVRAKNLEYAKRALAKIFGMGKASKKKPSAILDKAKDLYNTISDELKEEAGG